MHNSPMPGFIGLFIFFIFSSGITFAVVFYILTLQKALRRCSPQNSSMIPQHVWLLLIPLFNLVWHFRVVKAVSSSFDKEFSSRNIPAELNLVKMIGYAMCILSIIMTGSYLLIIIGITAFIRIFMNLAPVLLVLSGMALLVCWIIYWAMIYSLSNKIASPAKV